MKESYVFRLRCATCGSEDKFESNTDQSYVKCTFCNREYLGGIDELKELNQDAFDEVNNEIKHDAEIYISEALAKALKRFK